MEESEMRVYPRAAVCCPTDLFLAGAGEPDHAFVTDLSEGGAFVQSNRHIRRGDRLFMRLTMGDEDVAAMATEVTWVRRFDPIMVDGNMAGFGVRFLDLSQDDRSLIRSYVRKSHGGPQAVPPQIREVPVVNNENPSLVEAISQTEPIIEWHDTDVDDLASEQEEEMGGFFVGAEPDIGDPVIDEEQDDFAPLRRSEKKHLTLWLAAASLAVGIGAGALYGIMAPDPAPSETTNQLQPISVPVVAQADPAPTQIAEQVATPIKKAATPAPAKPAVKKKTVQKPKPVVAKIKTQKKKTGTHTKIPKKIATNSSGKITKTGVSLGSAAKATNGWFITLRGAKNTQKAFALSKPSRAVIDLPPNSGQALVSTEIKRGPFSRMRVGRSNKRVRLVLDLDNVVSPSLVRFVSKGGDLVIEVPTRAVAN